MTPLPSRLTAADLPRLVRSWWFAGAVLYLVAVAFLVQVVQLFVPRSQGVFVLAAGLSQPVVRALDEAAAATVHASANPRPAVRVQALARPFTVVVASSVRIRVAVGLAVTTAALVISAQNVWQYHLAGPLDLVVSGFLVLVPLMITEVIRRTIRSRAAVTGDPAPLAVQVVGFTHPFARAPVLEPVGGGPRLAVKVAWKWRQDLAVGDVLAWVGPWRSDEDGRHIFPTKVPLAVLACPRRDYLVLSAPEFPAAHPQQRKRRTPRTPGATSGPDG